MEFKETAVLIDHEDADSQDFMKAVRSYNKKGPHVYGDSAKCDRISRPTRLIRKNGKCNVARKTKSDLREKYLRDFSNTLVQSKWRWTILYSAASFILSWLIFAVVWMLISNANGDLEVDKPTDTPCLSGIRGFAGYFMFSLESQVSIGYGSRYINHHCPEGAIILAMQIIFGSAICGLVVNIVYMKMVKPTKRYSMKLFSKRAIICRRDGELCLIMRVRDDDSKHAIGTTINAYLLKNKKVPRSTLVPWEPCLESLPLEPYGFLIWPLEIVHKITSSSPLWDISSVDLLSDKFELIVTLEGTSPTTGQSTKTRSSYLSSEILWGHRFKSCVRTHREKNCYFVNHQLFNTTEEHAIHLCSAKRFDEVYSHINPTHRMSNFRFELNLVRRQSRSINFPIESVAGDIESLKSCFRDDTFDEVASYESKHNAAHLSSRENHTDEKLKSNNEFLHSVEEITTSDSSRSIGGSLQNVLSSRDIGLNKKYGESRVPKSKSRSIDMDINANPYRLLKPDLETTAHFMEPFAKYHSPRNLLVDNSFMYFDSNRSSVEDAKLQKAYYQFKENGFSGMSLSDLEVEQMQDDSKVDLDALLSSVEDYLEKNAESEKILRKFPTG